MSSALSKQALESIIPYLKALQSETTLYQQLQFEEIEVFAYAPSFDRLVAHLKAIHFIDGFDWMSWTKEAEQYLDKPEKLAHADLSTVRKLVTSHVRNESLRDGHLAMTMDSGHWTKLMERLQGLIEQQLI